MNIPSPIVPQIQPNSFACLPTCVAMLVGEPVESLGFDLSHGYEIQDFGVWFAERGLWLEWVPWVAKRGEMFDAGRVYLVKVASLNDMGGEHAVIYDNRRAPRVFDPNRGREGKQAYTMITEQQALAIFELCSRTDTTPGQPPDTNR